MILILMGVAGAGKTTVGFLLAKQLGWQYYEGDDYHPIENVQKMQNGIPLTDADRRGWLLSIKSLISRVQHANENAIITCSALKESYRSLLKEGSPRVRFVYLKGDFALIEQRLLQRQGHFMPPALLKSQFETLEEPADALIVSVGKHPNEIVDAIRSGLGI